MQDDADDPRMCSLPVSSQTVVSYLGYLLEAGTISAKSLQSYLSAINGVHNDFEYPPPVCGHLVKLARKSFAELQGSVILQPQQVTVFPTHQETPFTRNAFTRARPSAPLLALYDVSLCVSISPFLKCP